MLQADINLSFLSDSERELILEVLRRDEELHQAEGRRIRKLKTDLLDMKRRGAKRGSGKYSQRVCGRCLQPLSRLSAFSSQCRMCHHYICRDCRAPVGADGSCLCSVCAMESDLKKRTGDWFYDQRVNRFSASPGCDLVRSSMKNSPAPIKKRETTSEVLLRTTEVILETPASTPRTKLKQDAPHKSNASSENSGSIASRESSESREEVWRKPTRSDTESGDITSRSSTATESRHATPELPMNEGEAPQPILVDPSVSSLQVPVRIDHSSKTETDISDAKENSASTELEVDRLFKKSVRRAQRTSEYTSTLDLRNKPDSPPASVVTRSKSVPGLDAAEEEEEDEDIDSLVSFHKRNMASSTSSLNSKSTLGSMMSIYSEAGDYNSVEVSGDLVFSIKYDEHTQSLLVFIKECRGLAHGDSSRQQSNP